VSHSYVHLSLWICSLLKFSYSCLLILIETSAIGNSLPPCHCHPHLMVDLEARSLEDDLVVAFRHFLLCLTYPASVLLVHNPQFPCHILMLPLPVGLKFSDVEVLARQLFLIRGIGNRLRMEPGWTQTICVCAFHVLVFYVHKVFFCPTETVFQRLKYFPQIHLSFQSSEDPAPAPVSL